MSSENFKSLGELCTKITDGAHHSPKAFDGGLPMFSVKDMENNGFDYSKTKRISQEDYDKLIKSGCQPEKGDILIAKDGSVMKHIFDVKKAPDYVLLSSIAILRPKQEEVLPRYLVYALKDPLKEKDIRTNYVSGSGVPRIVLKDFAMVQINLPPLQEQKRIAHILGTLDDKIELNRKMNETLEAMAQALFKSWFVDFDPVIDNALAADNEIPEQFKERARSRSVQAKKGKFNHLFPSSFTFNETLNKWIPEGWEVKELKNITSKLGDGLHGTPIYDEKGDYHFINGNNLINGKVTFTKNTKRVNYSEFEKHKKTLNKRTIFVSINGTIGNVGEYQNEKIILGKSVCYFNVNDNIDKDYIKQTILSKSFFQYLETTATGTTIKNVSLKSMRQFPILIPNSNTILSIIGEKLKSFNDKSKKNGGEIEVLVKTRDTLLPKLISGQIAA